MGIGGRIGLCEERPQTGLVPVSDDWSVELGQTCRGAAARNGDNEGLLYKHIVAIAKIIPEIPLLLRIYIIILYI